MTFYCLIGQEMLNLITNCCKLLKVNQAAEQEVSSTDRYTVRHCIRDKSIAKLPYAVYMQRLFENLKLMSTKKRCD